MPSKHSIFSPSSADRHFKCPPSLRLEEQFPNETTAYAEEGTRAHALCEYLLRKYILGESVELEANPEEEMFGYCEGYKDFVEEELNEARAHTKDAKLLVEQELDFGEYIPEGFGTSDAVIISDQTLEVIDFKYGKGVPVNAIGNPQLRLYALGAFIALGSLYDFTTVKTTVFQPRIENISSEELTVDELLDWAKTYAQPRAELALKGEGEFCVGDHCRFCKAGAVCRARAEEAFKIVDHEKTAPELLSDEEIPDILDKLDETVKWIDAIKAYAQERAINGKKWGGYKLVEARTLRRIENQIEALNILNKLGYSAEEVTNTKLKGLGELEKLLSKKTFNEALGGLIVKPKGDPTLVKETDKRPEINPLEEAFKEE